MKKKVTKKKITNKKKAKTLVNIGDIQIIKDKTTAAWRALEAAEDKLASLYEVNMSSYDMKADLISDFIWNSAPETVEEFIEEMEELQ